MYRHCGRDAFGNLGDVENPEMLIGKVFTDKGFMSTSVVNKDGSSSGKREFMMKITVPEGVKGAYVNEISTYKDEYEFLFDKGTSIVITGYDDEYLLAEVIKNG